MARDLEQANRDLYVAVGRFLTGGTAESAENLGKLIEAYDAFNLVLDSKILSDAHLTQDGRISYIAGEV